MATRNKNSSNNMVESLTSLLKQVRIFGYGTSDLDSPLDPTLDYPLDQSYSESASSQVTDFQELSYSCSEFSSSSSLPEYNNTPSTELFPPSYTYQDETFSDKEEDNIEEEYGLEIPRRRTNRLSVVEEDTPSLPEFSMNEVAQHDMYHDCWIIFYDKVYDVTQFLYEHPGGEDLLMEHAGRDGTLAFRGVGHSKAALLSLQQYLLGVLPENERMFSSWENQ